MSLHNNPTFDQNTDIQNNRNIIVSQDSLTASAAKLGESSFVQAREPFRYNLNGKASFTVEYEDSKNQGHGAWLGIAMKLDSANKVIWCKPNTFLYSCKDGDLHFPAENATHYQTPFVGKTVIKFEHDRQEGTLDVEINSKKRQASIKNPILLDGDWYPTVQLQHEGQSVTFLNPVEF